MLKIPAITEIQLYVIGYKVRNGRIATLLNRGATFRTQIHLSLKYSNSVTQTVTKHISDDFKIFRCLHMRVNYRPLILIWK